MWKEPLGLPLQSFSIDTIFPLEDTSELILILVFREHFTQVLYFLTI